MPELMSHFPIKRSPDSRGSGGAVVDMRDRVANPSTIMKGPRTLCSPHGSNLVNDESPSQVARYYMKRKSTWSMALLNLGTCTCEVG